MHSDSLMCPRPHNLFPKSGDGAGAKNHPARMLRLEQPTTECHSGPNHSNILNTCLVTGCSKMSGCKARDIKRNEAYFMYAAVTNDERNAADGRFSTDCYGKERRVVSTYHCSCRTIPRSSRTSFAVSPARVSRRFILPSAISGLCGFKKPISTKSVRK